LPTLLGAQKIERVNDNVGLRRLYLASRSPVFGSDDYYAASVCAAILGMGKSSRLYRSLVREKQIAAEAFAFTLDLAKGTDLFVADVTGRPETDESQLVEAAECELEQLRVRGVTGAEVERAIALIATELMKALESASERADRMSMFATYFGDPSLINTQVSKYRSVTAGRVNEFARRHLAAENCVKLLYVPMEIPLEAGQPT
jgi:predicted Zn-dependent peptidase